MGAKVQAGPGQVGVSEQVEIVGVDEYANTIQMNVRGHSVTALCREDDNPEVYKRVKGILIDSAAKKKKGQKFDVSR